MSINISQSPFVHFNACFVHFILFVVHLYEVIPIFVTTCLIAKEYKDGQILSNLYFLVAVLFSCSSESTEPEGNELSSDAALIQAIQSYGDKETISVEELPSLSQSVLDDEYSDNYVDEAKLAPQLGYEVDTRKEEGTRIGDRWQVYFDLNGRELKSDRDSDRRREVKILAQN
jgi:hypothetical protein